MWEQTPAAEAYAQFICAVKRRSGRFESIASGVVTQETTLEDSMRNDTACPLQSLSLSVSPQERATATARMDISNAKKF